MDEFDLLRNVTIGQYIPTQSAVHRLDPRAKLVAAGVLILAASFARSVIPLALMLGVTLLIAWVARIPLGYVLRGVRLGLPLLIMLFVLQFLFYGWSEPAGSVYFTWNFLRVTRLSLQSISVGLLRIVCFIFLTSLVTMTSTVTELTHGIESLLRPFQRMGVPSHELALVNMIALRFVPTFAEQAEHVMKAQASRCGDVALARFWRPDKAARAMLPLIVPLFLNALRRAEDLVLAMESRSYMGGDGRTQFVTFVPHPRDYAVIALTVVIFAGIVFYAWPSLSQSLVAIGLPGL
jgi:energy-coupling factor transport system permease protein